MTIRWVKDMHTKQYHVLREAAVRVEPGPRAWHSTECGLLVEGKTFRDGFPPGADCVPCLQIAAQAGGSDARTSVPTV